VALYDTLGPEATQFICNECDLRTIALSKDQISKLTLLKIEDAKRSRKERKMRKLKNLIVFEDDFTLRDKKIASDAGLHLFSFEEVVFRGR